MRVIDRRIRSFDLYVEARSALLPQHVQLTVKLEGSAPAPDMTVPPSSRLVSSAELPSSDRSEYETKMLKLSETIAVRPAPAGLRARRLAVPVDCDSLRSL